MTGARGRRIGGAGAWAARVAGFALLLAFGSFPPRSARASSETARSCAAAEPAVRSAAEALDEGRWADAERSLLPLAASDPPCAGVSLELARFRGARGDAAGAEQLFERATALAPDDARGLALFAQHWLSRGQMARADYLSTRAVSLDPRCPEALVAQGRVLLARGRIQEALQALETAVRVAPNAVEPRYELGILFFRRQLHPDAVRALERVVARRPTDARAHDYLALSFEALGQPERAERAYLSALKVNDDGPFFDAYLDYNYGRFLLKQHRLAESRSHLDRAVDRLPRDRAAWYERSKLHLALGDYPAARGDAERALALRDAGSVLDLQVYYLLATVYRRLGETELARKYSELARTTPIPGQD